MTTELALAVIADRRRCWRSWPLLIDRRALLVSGLAYLGGAIGYALTGAAAGSGPGFMSPPLSSFWAHLC